MSTAQKIKRQMESKNIKQNKIIFNVILALSAVVLLVVLLLNRKVIPRPENFITPVWVYSLPALNATLNGLCSILLMLSIYFIKRKQIAIHKKLNITCFALSCMFLISYITYHYLCEETRFPADHPLKYVYYFILASHIILSAIVLPMVLLSFYYGLTNQIAKHRKITRWSFPVWLYVTITGVVVYLMISPHYQH